MIISILNNEILIDFCENIFSNTQDVLQFDVKNAYSLIHTISSSRIYLNLIQIYKTKYVNTQNTNLFNQKLQVNSN